MEGDDGERERVRERSERDRKKERKKDRDKEREGGREKRLPRACLASLPAYRPGFRRMCSRANSSSERAEGVESSTRSPSWKRFQEPVLTNDRKREAAAISEIPAQEN